MNKQIYVFIYKPPQSFVGYPNLRMVHVTDDPGARPSIFRPENQNPDEMMIWLLDLPDLTAQVFHEGLVDDVQEDRIIQRATKACRAFLKGKE